MSYFAAAVVRDDSGWTAAEMSLRGVTDLDETAERLRDVEPDAEVSLLFVEADDAYLVVLRLDEGEDLRVFGSDSAYAEESPLGSVLVGDLKAPDLDDVGESRRTGGGGGEESDQPAADPEADPVGDADLLADLGIPAQRLVTLCTREGMLPADVTAEICQVLGCADEVEELRGV